MDLRTRRICLVLAALWSVIGLTAAEEVHAQNLLRIQVVGAQTVRPEQVVAWSGLQVDESVSAEGVAEAIRRLYGTGKFRDVFVYQVAERGGLSLILNLTEYPRLSEVRFEGIDKLDREDLETEIDLQPGDFLSPARLGKTTRAIREKYRSEGYYNATVNVDEETLRLTGIQPLVLRIAEGSKVKVKSITFVGNQALDEGTLRGAMKTKPGGFLRSGTFKAPEFEQDLESIAQKYRDEGYLDAQILRHELNFRPGENHLDLVIEVSEGTRYLVGQLTFEGNTIYDEMTVARMVILSPGRVFKESDYQESLRNLHSLYWEDGYIYIVVSPQRSIRDGNIVDVAFSFREGSQARVRQVHIQGNTKTHENVIRREMRILPGDLFVNSELRDSQGDIFRLGYFGDVRVDFEQTPEPDEIDLIFEVEEKQTGQFTMGVGFSQQTQASGFFQIGETNLFGRGQSLNFAWQFGRRSNMLDISFTEPWFMGTPTLIGVDVYNRFSNRVNDFYDTRVRGFAVRLGRPIPRTRFTRATLRYSYNQTTLRNFDPFYVRTLDDLERQLGSTGVGFQRLDKVDWPQLESGVSATVVRNSTNNPFFPTGGSRALGRYEVIGGIFGGDLDYQRVQGEYDWYQALPWRFAFHFGGAAGHIGTFGTASGVPDYERFRLGGNRFYSLRGYRDLEVVPRGNPSFVGGRFYAKFTTEIAYPLARAVHVLAFVDQGDTWNSFSEADLTRLRTGAGFGIRLEVPLVGRIGFDFGYGFDKEGLPSRPGWETHFNFGQFF